MTAPCIGPALAYNPLQALQKREYERLAVPVSDGFFAPEIRLDFAPVVASLQCRGRAGCIRRKAMRRSRIRFLNPPVPGAQAGSLSCFWRLDHGL
jgi:hypothetical protein